MKKSVTVETDTRRVIVDLTEDELRTLLSKANLTELGKVAPGKVIKAGKYEFIVFKQMGDRTACLMRYALDKRRKFDDNTVNYADSSIRKFLNTEFYEELAKEVGADNILEHAVDLTTEDGLKLYGSVTDKVSLITDQMYRDNRDVIGPNLDAWWWTATACSKQETCTFVRAVSNDGILGYYDYGIVGGVRPFCILKSNILVSEVEE